jgi:hypothetical protein
MTHIFMVNVKDALPDTAYSSVGGAGHSPRFGWRIRLVGAKGAAPVAKSNHQLLKTEIYTLTLLQMCFPQTVRTATADIAHTQTLPAGKDQLEALQWLKENQEWVGTQVAALQARTTDVVMNPPETSEIFDFFPPTVPVIEVKLIPFTQPFPGPKMIKSTKNLTCNTPQFASIADSNDTAYESTMNVDTPLTKCGDRFSPMISPANVLEFQFPLMKDDDEESLGPDDSASVVLYHLEQAEKNTSKPIGKKRSQLGSKRRIQFSSGRPSLENLTNAVEQLRRENAALNQALSSFLNKQ